MRFLMPWTYFHKHDKANWIYVTVHAKHFFFLKHIPQIWQCIGFNVVSRLNSKIYPVGCVDVSGMKLKTPGNKCKKALNLISPLPITSWIFWGPGFWIPSKGIISRPNVDWPCSDFTQGSTSEQPSKHGSIDLVYKTGMPRFRKLTVDLRSLLGIPSKYLPYLPIPHYTEKCSVYRVHWPPCKYHCIWPKFNCFCSKYLSI